MPQDPNRPPDVEVVRVEVGDQYSARADGSGGGYYGAIASEPGYNISIRYGSTAFITDRELERARSARAALEPASSDGLDKPPTGGLLESAIAMLSSLVPKSR